MLSLCRKIKMQYAWITDPFNTVKDPDIIGDGEVYPVHSEKLTEAIQHTILLKENKRSLPMRVLSCNVQRPSDNDFRSLLGIYYKYRAFMLIECGKSSMRKDCIVADIDENIDTQTFFNKLKEIENIPECVCTRNKINGHWQIQFYLRNPVYVKRIDFSEKNENGKMIPCVKRDESQHYLYIRTVKRFAAYFKKVFGGADINYQGTMCRNPYYPAQESYVFKHERFISLHSERTFGVNFSDLVEFLDNKKVILRKNINLDVDIIAEKEVSRHKLTMVYARKWMWNCMRNGKVPSENELADYLIESKYEIADKCNKEPHSDKEILSQVNSLYNWCVINFHEKNLGNQWKSSVYWNRNQRAAKIKYVKKIKKEVLAMLGSGESISGIASWFGVSRVTMYSYMAIIYAIDLVKTRNHFEKSEIKFMVCKSWDEIIAEVCDIIKKLKMKCGESKIKWKDLNYDLHINDYENVARCDLLSLDGNYNLEKRYEIIHAA